MDPDVISLLRQVPFFAELDEASLRVLAGRSRRRRFGAGEALFHEDDPGHTLYVIVSGRVKIQIVTAGGGLVHIASRGRGETVGEMALIDGKPRMADAVTSEPSDLLILERAEFVRSVEESPRLALGIMACLADRLRESADQVKRLQSQDVLGRVAAALLHRFETADAAENSPTELPINQAELAEEVATTRESVNRALSRLKAAGAIHLEERRVLLADPQKLRRFAQR
jgi:CRP/FNR family transcriptional regulator, cyclic AMP receptor protein